jgi:hypothetical protein
VEWQNFGVTGEDGRAVTVTSARYVEMLRNFLTQELSRRGNELSTLWFQQDGATAHTERASMEVVQEMFLEHVILLSGELPWPARSPDLSACHYFLWTHLKAKMYTTRPRTIDDFKIAIWKQISAIPENMARRALGNLRARLEVCVYTMMVNILVMRCSKRNKQRRNEMYVEYNDIQCSLIL